MRLRGKICLAALLAGLCGCASPMTENDRRANALLRQMTLSEKIGQMNQIASSTGAITGPMSERLSCDEAVKKGWCGSILGIKDPAEIERLQHLAVDSSRLGIPILFGHDIIHGCRTIFPENRTCRLHRKYNRRAR